MIALLLVAVSTAQMTVTATPSEEWILEDILSAAHGDVDGDGDDDAIVGSWHGLGWYETTDGSLGELHVVVRDSLYLSAIHPDDVDGDGDLDVIAQTNGGSVVYFENLGGGTFGPAISIDPDTGSLSLSDLDGDGDRDLVVVDAFPPEVRAFESLGTGAFALHTSALGPDMFQGALADLDGDGRLDLVTADASNLYVSPGLPGLQFGAGTLLGPWDGRFKILAGDIDNDGDADLIVEGTRLYNDNPGWTAVVDADMTDMDSLVDFDLDGDLDVMAVSWLGAGWVINDGDSWPYQTGWGPAFSTEVSSPIDLDSDGDFELLWAGESVGWGDPLVDDYTDYERARVSRWTLVRAGDIDGDGIDEIVRWSEGEGLVWSKAGVPSPIDPSIVACLDAVVLDLDGDGWSDVVVLDEDDRVVLYRFDGVGFDGGTELVGPFDGVDIAVGDIDVDGVDDLLVGLDNELAWVAVVPGGGLQPLVYLMDLSWVQFDGLTLADLDGDGADDLLVTPSPTNSGPGWARNLGGTFGTFSDLGFQFGASKLLVGDFEGDGDLDLYGLSHDLTFTRVELALNLGGGIFQIAYESVWVPALITDAAWLDLDGDGDLDFAATVDGFYPGPPMVFEYDVNAGAEVFFDGPVNSNTLTVGDFDGDGRDELASGDSTGVTFYSASPQVTTGTGTGSATGTGTGTGAGTGTGTATGTATGGTSTGSPAAGGDKSGCGCAHVGPAPLGWLALLPILAVRRRHSTMRTGYHPPL